MTGSVQVNKGKWYCVLNFKDENGKRKPKWISTGLAEKGNKKKAQALLNELLVKYEGHDTLTNFSDMFFSEYCDYWLKGKKETIDVSTYESYEFRIAHIKHYFETRKIIVSKITPRDIKEFYEYLLCNGNRAKYKKAEGLSSRTIKDIAVVLKSILKEAVLLGDIVSNPAEGISIPKRKKECIKHDIFIDEEDMKILLSETKGRVLEELITLTLFYGLRRSEVLGLKWNAIDFENDSVRIAHTVVKIKGMLAKDTTKTGASFRTYPMSDYIKEKLMKVKREQEFYQRLFGSEYIKSDYIFTWQDGRPITPDYVTKAFKKIVSRCPGLSSELTFHDLRKSCVSMMIDDGYSIKEIQKWVGHADVDTTLNIYAKVKESRKKHIGDAMGEKFRQAI